MKKIISTGKSEHMPKGKVYAEGEALAKVLVDNGFAYYEGEEPHIVTEHDLELNPELVEAGVQVGEEIILGPELTPEEVAELKEKVEIDPVKEKAEVKPAKGKKKK